MLFSSISFLYYFLPILLLIYFIVPKRFKNLVLLIASLLFYFYGESKYIVILLFSCCVNYLFALLIDRENKSKLRIFYLVLCILIDLGLLLYFKYTNFFIENINNLINTNISLLEIVMPIGISFFTFQTLSYVIDVYEKKVKADTNFLSFSTYVCLFPQLVAGPIVRYITVRDELKDRNHSIDSFAMGVRRFTFGLAKKVMIANVIGELCKTLGQMGTPTVVSYWMSAIGYTLQIYFDFSGYSDMAIGLGLMFGFHFLENFNYPFISKSITEFWRRWHISLSSWLRDYVYIPLGGNRVSMLKWLRNILVVWFLTGFWHGASWNFIIWGLYFAIILIGEKLLWGKILTKSNLFAHFYSIILIVISFVIFNASNIDEAFIFIKSMFGFNHLPFINFETLYYLRSYLVLFIISIIASTPLVKIVINKIKAKIKIIEYFEPLYLIGLIIIVTAFLIDASFNPFLYFRF